MKRIWNEFSFHTVFMKLVVCFISPRHRLRDIKHTTHFINNVWNRNSFQILYVYFKYLVNVFDNKFTYVTIYIYCPVWRETWRFVQPRKFMSPEGEARRKHEFSGLNKSSCFLTNWAINCLLYRKLKEYFLSRKHALNRSFAYFGLSFSVSETWRAKHVLWRHSHSRWSAVPWDTAGRQDVWRETRRFVF